MKIVIVAIMMVFLFCGCGEDSHNVNIADIRKIARLRVLQVQVAETLTLETKNSKQFYLVVGYGDYEIDFEKIKKEHSKDGVGVVLRMPPLIIDPSVDATKTRTYDRYTTIGYKDNKIHKMRMIVDQEAKKLVLKSAKQESYMKIAKEQTEKILNEMLPAQNITFKWDD